MNHGDGVGRCGENVSPFAFVLLKKNLYVITLKSFNRIFDYSLADAFFVRWLLPHRPF